MRSRYFARIAKLVRPCALLVALALAQTALAQTPSADELLGVERARSLLLRTGFAPREAEVHATAKLSLDAALAQIVRAAPAKHAAPAQMTSPIVAYQSLANEEARQAQRREHLRQITELKAWWMREMIETPTPLAERLVLFWHNHFASSERKVRYPQLMYEQHQTLRREALGSYASLLRGITRDPAMLLYLDGAQNRKESPNENFAREVMELFALGEGHYTEQDIKEAARALSGLGVERETFRPVFRAGLHDAGPKTIFGKTQAFTPDSFTEHLLRQPQVARHIVQRLAHEFSVQLSKADHDRLAESFRASGYEIKPLVNALFKSDSFWREGSQASGIKSPVELIVGAVRQFDIAYTDPLPFAVKAAQLGQDLFVPPNVKGWPGGEAWITSVSLLERKRFMEQVLRAVEAPQAGVAQGGAAQGGMDMQAVQGARGVAQEMRAAGQRVRLGGREGFLRVAQAQAGIWFDAERFLGSYGLYMDREPSTGERARLEQAVLARAAANPPQAGLVGVALLRALVLDPAYQLR